MRGRRRYIGVYRLVDVLREVKSVSQQAASIEVAVGWYTFEGGTDRRGEFGWDPVIARVGVVLLGVMDPVLDGSLVDLLRPQNPVSR